MLNKLLLRCIINQMKFSTLAFHPCLGKFRTYHNCVQKLLRGPLIFFIPKNTRLQSPSSSRSQTHVTTDVFTSRSSRQSRWFLELDTFIPLTTLLWIAPNCSVKCVDKHLLTNRRKKYCYEGPMIQDVNVGHHSLNDSIV